MRSSQTFVDTLRKCFHFVERLILIDCRHGVAHGWREIARIRDGPDEQRHPVHAHLRGGQVHLRRDLISNAFLTNVSDNAYNRAAESLLFCTTEPDVLSNRIAIREVAPCKLLVDDCDFLPVCGVARVVSAAAQQRYLHRSKIFRRNAADADRWTLLLVHLRMAFDTGKSDDRKA